MLVAISGSLFSLGVRLATLNDRLLGNFFNLPPPPLPGALPGEPAWLSRASVEVDARSPGRVAHSEAIEYEEAEEPESMLSLFVWLRSFRGELLS